MTKSLIIGSTVCDIIINVDYLPTTTGDVHIKSQQMSLGGCAFNVASVLHHLGTDYIFISPGGTGIYGDFVKDELNKLNMESLVNLEGENGCCYCFVEDHGERTFMSHHGVEYSFNPEWLAELDMDEYDYIYICGLEVEEADGEVLIETLKNVRGQIIFCPGPRGHLISKERMQRVYDLQPIVHLNEDEVKVLMESNLLEEAVEKLYLLTDRPVVVTQGALGALIYDGNHTFVEGYSSNVVDTIGAGDSHAGAMIAWLMKDNSLKHAVRYANYYASKVVGVKGTKLDNETKDRLLKKF